MGLRERKRTLEIPVSLIVCGRMKIKWVISWNYLTNVREGLPSMRYQTARI
jgi:hypothetical protein